MNIEIRQINRNPSEIEKAKSFLFDQIDKEYHIGPTPKFHYDIFDLEDYYISSNKSNFFVAMDGEKIVATGAVRAYDKDYDFFKDIYSKEDTASIWRLMVDKNYRRNGLARLIVGEMEKFAREEGYTRIYLHTHRYLEAALPFWKSLGYSVTIEEDDYDETSHMIKNL
ncbi:MAG: GNAT family N-acetyltransferase [Methanobrevibacter sp.]|uniref:GNAT family N-acetyltransferase n=1 Tax=Methanobrevibacter sp. TaxID=66852 RepID=UPI002600853F|nr:GNAT family N-acetyltransferase [Methanobrevibacter sp.]MBQ6098299.1 GNAT family N-acetyltransferase [Methanobrevibacter sp.]